MTNHSKEQECGVILLINTKSSTPVLKTLVQVFSPDPFTENSCRAMIKNW